MDLSKSTHSLVETSGTKHMPRGIRAPVPVAERVEDTEHMEVE